MKTALAITTLTICSISVAMFLAHWYLEKRKRGRNRRFLCARCEVNLKIQSDDPETILRYATLQEQHWYCAPCAALLRKRERWFFTSAALIVIGGCLAIFYIS